MVHDGHGRRWIDSLWVRRYKYQDGAEERCEILNRIFDAMITGPSGLKAWVVALRLEDGTTEPNRTTPQDIQPEIKAEISLRAAEED